MSSLPKPISYPLPARGAAPPLENGDRLSRDEFERRYQAMPHVKKAELIEGLVHMPSPVRFQHSGSHLMLAGWLFYYMSKTPPLDLASDNGTVRLDPDNEPQPDLSLLLPQALGGRGKLDEDGYLSGPPDWVCEIAASSVSIDMHRKLQVYQRNGIREYLVWRTEDREVDWFILRDGRYEPLRAGEDGVLRSEAFPGLWLHREALLKGERSRLLATLDRGVATPEHAAFVRQLTGAPPR